MPRVLLKWPSVRDASKGVVLLLTLGTGVGSALFTNGKLVPNTELGHLYFRGPAEKFVSDATRKAEELSWNEWASRLNAYLAYVEILLWPELMILGGGVSKQHEEFIGHLTTRACRPCRAAQQRWHCRCCHRCSPKNLSQN